jgi:cytidylate kinase
MALVSFSREEGSLGGRIAREVGERMGWRVLDLRALLEEAQSYGGLKPTASELYEKQPGLLERLDRERRRYQAILRAVVYKVALDDNVVFLGRGVGMLLGDLNHAFRVLVVAPHDVRVEQVMRTGTSGRPGAKTREEAEDIVRRADQGRAGYFRYLFNVDWLDPLHHDLVINTGTVAPESVTDVVVEALERLQLSPTPETLGKLAELARMSHAEAERLRRG